LTKPDKLYAPLDSTNSWSEKRREEFDQVCGSLLQGNRTMHEGFGTMIVDHDKYGIGPPEPDLVKVRKIFIELPATIKESERKAEFYFDVWVYLKDLVYYLKTIEP
jgi:hypothetical protein